MRHFQSLTRRPTLTTVLSLTMAAIVGCATKQTEQPVERTARKVVVDQSEATPETMAAGLKADTKAKEDFEMSLKQNLEQIDEEIRQLRVKIGALQESAKADWADRMAGLELKRKAAEAKLEAVRNSAGGAWEHLREGAGRAWEELEQAVKKAQAEF
jgi:hypothetical protein